MTDTAEQLDDAADTADAAEVVEVDPTEDERWARLVETKPTDVFQSPGWLRAIRDGYDMPLRARVLVDRDGTPAAGFVFADVDDMMDPRIVSLPFSDFCDPVVETEAQWSALVGDLLERRVHMKCLHSTIPVDDDRLEQVGRSRWHAVDLDRPTDDIWAGISSSARRSIRKARAEDVEITATRTIEDVRAFFELHLRVRKHKYQLLAQPWRFFEAIWEHLIAPGSGVMMLARHEGVALGGVLFLEWGDTLYYKFNASDADHLVVRPNDLVIWNGIEYAKERGLGRFDFGLSDWDQEGLLRFKRKYATEEGTIHALASPAARLRSASEQSMRTLLPQLTDLFVAPETPDDVTEQAGDRLYRYFT